MQYKIYYKTNTFISSLGWEKCYKMSVRIVEPVLFPISVNEIDVLKFCGEHNIKDVDIILNYGYQLTHYNMLIAYVDPELQVSCIEAIKDTVEYDDVFTFIDEVSKILIENVYKDYYLLFLCTFLKEIKSKHNFMEEFSKWLYTPHDYTYKMTTKPRLIFNLQRYYNTVIIPKLWDDNSGNLYNRIHQYPANYFSQKDTIKEAGKHLIEEGQLCIINSSDYGKVLFSLEGDYKEVNKNVFQKQKIPKKVIRIGHENKL